MNVEHDDGDVPQEEILKMVQYDNLNLVVINDSPYFPGGGEEGEGEGRGDEEISSYHALRSLPGILEAVRKHQVQAGWTCDLVLRLEVLECLPS